MFPKAHSQITIVALILSIAALILSIVSLAKTTSSNFEAELDKGLFKAKVEEGIKDYIEKQKQGTQGKAPLSNGNVERIKVSIDDDAVKGNKKAPVTIIEFSDYECPFCARFHETTLPSLIADYIDTGKAQLVFRDFPLSFHRQAKPAAMAAECAREQGGDKIYFQYHDQLFKNQTQLGDAQFKKWAVDLGLKSESFNECLDSKKYANEVEKDFKEAQSYGVTGSPTFFINGRRLSGALPFSDFKKVIEEELVK